MRTAAIQAQEFLAEALRIARTIVNAEKHPDETIVMVDDHVGVLSRIIEGHAPPGVTVTERNLAEEIDRVVTHTLTDPGTTPTPATEGRRATATVFRKLGLKPVGEPYDPTVTYIEAHYLVDQPRFAALQRQVPI
ncbi:hypothetical protein [Rhodococcus rhodochrous]|uniref:hypothetical protein n=1 Tax=Rhodococcus rhodochrous TaxID=1829 RepID=UPI001D029B6B|nr:hypothetical protein [Rhodococcus rhodochrous]